MNASFKPETELLTERGNGPGDLANSDSQTAEGVRESDVTSDTQMTTTATVEETGSEPIETEVPKKSGPECTTPNRAREHRPRNRRANPPSFEDSSSRLHR